MLQASWDSQLQDFPSNKRALGLRVESGIGIARDQLTFE